LVEKKTIIFATQLSKKQPFLYGTGIVGVGAINTGLPTSLSTESGEKVTNRNNLQIMEF
jgi:hypothetical protein